MLNKLKEQISFLLINKFIFREYILANLNWTFNENGKDFEITRIYINPSILVSPKPKCVINKYFTASLFGSDFIFYLTKDKDEYTITIVNDEYYQCIHLDSFKYLKNHFNEIDIFIAKCK